jgi:hypothetical protein
MQEEFLVWVDGLTEAELDQSIKDAPPQFELLFGTWRNGLMLRAIHWMQHYGQLTDCRRAAGRPPLIFWRLRVDDANMCVQSDLLLALAPAGMMRLMWV